MRLSSGLPNKSNDTTEQVYESMCDCITKVNAELKPRNLEIVGRVRIVGNKLIIGPVCIEVQDINYMAKRKRNKGISLFATYCPFCGEKYPEG